MMSSHRTRTTTQRRKSLKSKRHLDIIRAFYTRSRWIKRNHLCVRFLFLHLFFVFKSFCFGVFFFCFRVDFFRSLWIIPFFGCDFFLCSSLLFISLSFSWDNWTRTNSMSDEKQILYFTQMQALLLSTQSWNRKYNTEKKTREKKMFVWSQIVRGFCFSLLLCRYRFFFPFSLNKFRG